MTLHIRPAPTPFTTSVLYISVDSTSSHCVILVGVRCLLGNEFVWALPSTLRKGSFATFKASSNKTPYNGGFCILRLVTREHSKRCSPYRECKTKRKKGIHWNTFLLIFFFHISILCQFQRLSSSSDLPWVEYS